MRIYTVYCYVLAFIVKGANIEVIAASGHSCDTIDMINKSIFDTTTSTDVTTTTLPAAAEREADGS